MTYTWEDDDRDRAELSFCPYCGVEMKDQPYVWMYERIERRNGLDKFYQTFIGRETCDPLRPEVYQLGRIFTRKANAERFCKLANRQRDKVTP